MTDFSTTVIRCSQIGKLMTEPKSVADKSAGNLSQTAKEMLVQVYISRKYGREKDMTSKFTEKGKFVEDESITMLSFHEQKPYEKNTERVTDEWFTGEYDLYLGNSPTDATEIIDIKSSWDVLTFLSNLTKPLEKDYYWQLQGYMALSGATVGKVAYVLADCPPHILLQQQRSLLYNMNVASEEAPEYIEACEKLERMLTYGDIPLREKVLTFPVMRNEEDIQLARGKVLKAREFLAELEQKHCK